MWPGQTLLPELGPEAFMASLSVSRAWEASSGSGALCCCALQLPRGAGRQTSLWPEGEQTPALGKCKGRSGAGEEKGRGESWLECQLKEEQAQMSSRVPSVLGAQEGSPLTTEQETRRRLRVMRVVS